MVMLMGTSSVQLGRTLQAGSCIFCADNPVQVLLFRVGRTPLRVVLGGSAWYLVLIVLPLHTVPDPWACLYLHQAIVLLEISRTYQSRVFSRWPSKLCLQVTRDFDSRGFRETSLAIKFDQHRFCTYLHQLRPERPTQPHSHSGHNHCYIVSQQICAGLRYPATWKQYYLTVTRAISTGTLFSHDPNSQPPNDTGIPDLMLSHLFPICSATKHRESLIAL